MSRISNGLHSIFKFANKNRSTQERELAVSKLRTLQGIRRWSEAIQRGKQNESLTDARLGELTVLRNLQIKTQYMKRLKSASCGPKVADMVNALQQRLQLSSKKEFFCCLKKKRSLTKIDLIYRKYALANKHKAFTEIRQFQQSQLNVEQKITGYLALLMKKKLIERLR